MTKKEDITSIKISKFLKSKLDKIGSKGETYEEIIMKLIINSNKDERR